MGEHRSASSKRGISKGPLIAIALVAMLVAAIFTWRLVSNRISEQAETAAGSCVKGTSEVPIVVAPELTEPLRDIANRYNGTKPVVRDFCITVSVHEGNSTQVRQSLSDEIPWNISTLGPQPAAWIPSSSLASNQLAAVKPGLIDGQPRSLASSPIVLAMPALAAKNLSETNLTWADLPRLQVDPSALNAANLPGWGGLRLSLPLSENSDAADLAAQTIAAALAGSSPGPLM